MRVDKGKWDKSRGLEEDYNFTYEWIEKCRSLLTDNGTIWISGIRSFLWEWNKLVPWLLSMVESLSA